MPGRRVHLCEEVFESAGGLGWLSTNLTDRDRSVAVIAALVTQDVTDQRLATYLSLARRTESTSTWPPS